MVRSNLVEAREIFNCVAKPTIESAQALMNHKDIRLLVVTGGGGVVKAAMASGESHRSRTWQPAGGR